MDLKYSLILLTLWLLVAAAFWRAFIYPRSRRRKLDSSQFPTQWLPILRKSLTVYKLMWPDQQEQLRKLIVRFIADKKFIGCAGQQITDEIRVTIAAHACLLLLNRPNNEYADLHSILVYPAAFIVTRDSRDNQGLVSTNEQILAGESWSTGKVILSWDNVTSGVRSFRDGHNVVLHEFAHQLDGESGITNGAPLLYSKNAYASWTQVLTKEFEALREASAAHRHTLIDEYGATNPAEFFAVVTETFFEQPYQLEERHKALFDELLNYYRVDPREWQHKKTRETNHHAS